jgi:hypothetical protein
VHKKLEYLYIRIITITLIKFKVENSHKEVVLRFTKSGWMSSIMSRLGGGTLLVNEGG